MAEGLDPGVREVPDTGPGGTQEPAEKPMSYADRLKTNIRYDQRLKRNVLDIEIEKFDKENEIDLGQTCVARLLKSIGMNIETQLVGYQVIYGRVVTLSVWCTPGVDLEKFCRTENIQVTRGVWTKNIRPAGRRDVVVTVSGLDFNTPDTLVQGYIGKFGGKLVSQEVIYGKHGDGPLKGVFNGDRKYNVEFQDSARPMGTYHFLDGAKARIFYRGNSKTCARCHQVSGSCPGGGYAKECQSQGGARVDLAERMRELWNEIGFTPTTFELPAQADLKDNEKESDESKLEGDTVISEETSFRRQIERPEMKEDDVKKIIGIQVRNFPPTMAEDDVVSFLADHVDENITLERVSFMKNDHSINAAVESGLDGTKVMAATKEIEFIQSKKKYFGKPLYCRILKNLTPEKIPPTPPPNAANESNPNKNLQKEFDRTVAKPKDASKQSVKDKTTVFEGKADDKKLKQKAHGEKIVEYGLTNTTAQQIKRGHKEVGSPTSPELKKSPKKPKAGDKPAKN